MKKRLLIAIILIAILIAGPLVAPAWSPMNCRNEEINVKTGQARYSRYLWYVRVSKRVEDTVLSKALGGESVDVADIAPWHMVNTFSPGLHYSPHYMFHGALAQIRNIELLFEMFKPDAQHREQVARDILRLWQTAGSDMDVRSYISELPAKWEKNAPAAANIPEDAP